MHGAAVVMTAVVPVLAQETAGTLDLPIAMESKHRSYLPVPNAVRPKLITYDAKNPDTKSPR